MYVTPAQSPGITYRSNYTIFKSQKKYNELLTGLSVKIKRPCRALKKATDILQWPWLEDIFNPIQYLIFCIAKYILKSCLIKEIRNPPCSALIHLNNLSFAFKGVQNVFSSKYFKGITHQRGA